MNSKVDELERKISEDMDELKTLGSDKYEYEQRIISIDKKMALISKRIKKNKKLMIKYKSKN